MQQLLLLGHQPCRLSFTQATCLGLLLRLGRTICGRGIGWAAGIVRASIETGVLISDSCWNSQRAHHLSAGTHYLASLYCQILWLTKHGEG